MLSDMLFLHLLLIWGIASCIAKPVAESGDETAVVEAQQGSLSSLSDVAAVVIDAEETEGDMKKKGKNKDKKKKARRNKKNKNKGDKKKKNKDKKNGNKKGREGGKNKKQKNGKNNKNKEARETKTNEQS